MYVFIDESGVFANPGAKPHTVSAVAALCIPEPQYEKLEKKYSSLSKSWPRSKDGEVKGSKLNERQISSLVTLLGRHDVILNTCFVDLGIEEDKGIRKHQEHQVGGITNQVTQDHLQELQASAQALAERLGKLAPNLYVQAQLQVQLLRRVHQTATLRYAQSDPAALENFRWRVDAKDKNITEYESVWLTIVKPLMQSISLSNPIILLKTGDYSAFERFKADPAKPRDHLPNLSGSEEPRQFTDLNKLLDEDFKLCDSKSETGIRLVDILVNATQRAMNGRLQRRGWRNLGRLMIRDVQGGSASGFHTFSADSARRSPSSRLPYKAVIDEIEKKARSVFVS